MATIKEIVNRKIEQRFNGILNAIDEERKLKNISLEEILSIAGKIKRNNLIEIGEMSEIERESEREYGLALSFLSKDVADKYIEIKDGDDPSLLSSLELPIDDIQFKLEYIESRISYNQETDRAYLTEAIRKVAERKEEIEFKKIKGLHKSVSKESSFEDFFDLYFKLSQNTSEVLFDRSLQKSLIRALEGDNLTILIYKCLRLTHDLGIPNICSNLEDHLTQDKDGQNVKFLGNSDVYQLDQTRELYGKVLDRAPNISLIMLISDFDLWKFGSETAMRLMPMAKEYLNRVKHYLPEIEVTFETDYIKSFPNFETNFNKVFNSIKNGEGRFIHPEEFSRIERDYNNTFSGTINNWTEERNHHYSLSSVSRNISTGIALDNSDGNFLFVFYNNNTINGERINLGVKNKIPCIAYPKRKSKQIL